MTFTLIILGAAIISTMGFITDCIAFFPNTDVPKNQNKLTTSIIRLVTAILWVGFYYLTHK